MKSLLLLFLIQGLALLFLVIPYDAQSPVLIEPFLFSDVEIIPRSFVWMVFERVNVCILIYIIKINISYKYERYVMAFMVMELLRFVEFMLNYNTPWIHLFGFILGVSQIFIIFKSIIIGFAVWEQSK